MSEEIKDLYSNVNNILKNINVKEIDPNEKDFVSVPSGYYLCSFKFEVTTAKKNGNLQIKATAKIVDNGITTNEDGDYIEIPKTKNKNIWKYYSLKDEDSIKKLIKDMKKFEDEEGNSLLSDEDFNSMEQIELSCEVLEEMQLFVHVNNYTKENGEEGSSNNLLSWKRAEELGLLSDEE